MVKRIVDTAFWTDMQVIDNYSVEDKYFSLYLMTNSKTTQVGIYPLPKKVISFETGFTIEVIQVLLDRFSEVYGKIFYSEKTQEVTVLHSLQSTILKGGTPVSDLLEKELSNVKDSELILKTYEEMKEFWQLSKRKFDKTIQELFENELTNRGLFISQNEKDNEIQIHNTNDTYNVSDSHNHNDNEESGATNRIPNRAEDDEVKMLDSYSNYLKKIRPDFMGVITPENIVNSYYEQMIGELHPHIEQQLKHWQRELPTSLVLEALHRSTKANNPILYVASIVDSWKKAGVENYKDVIKLDKRHNQNK